MLVFDKVDINQSKREHTPEGYLRVPANLARVGVYDYRAGDIGMTDRDPMDQVKVYRPADQVFDETSMNSFSLKPVTNGHPPEMVNIKNIKQYQVGNAASAISRNGDFMVTELLVTDSAMISAIEDGKCEVSNGYTADFDFVIGATENGERYDAIQKNIRGNHIAIVDNARGGRGCRLSDEQKKEQNMKKIVFDGMTIEVTEQGEQVIGKLQSKVEGLETDLATGKVTNQAAMDSKDAEWQAKLDAKQDEVKAAEAKIVTDEQIDARIESRAALVTDAKLLKADLDASGKSDAQIIEEVVMDSCDGLDLTVFDEVSKPVYCKARFDALLAVASKGDGADKMNVKVDDEQDVVDGDKARSEFSKKTEKAYEIKEA